MARGKFIKLNTQTTGHGILRVGIETPYVTDFINEYYKVAKDTTEDMKVLTNMAWFVINKAEEEGLIPFCDEYELKEDADYSKFYSMQKNGDKRKRVYWEDATDFYKQSDKDKVKSPTNAPTYHHRVYDVHSKRPYDTVTYTKGALNRKMLDVRGITNGKLDIVTRSKPASYIMYVPHNYKRITQKVYADRPPHLSDVDTTHTVVINGRFVGVKIYAKKRPSKKFKNGEDAYEYGLVQYTADDSNWNRFTPGTTSYWLHAVLGLNPNGKNSPHSVQNYRELTQMLKAALAKKAASNLPIIKI